MNGTVSLYQCGCHKTGECWIVRHPRLPVPISYPTQVEANAALAELVKTSTGRIHHMKTNAEKLAEARAALETLKIRMAKFTEGIPSSLIHEEMRLVGLIDWYEQAEADRLAKIKVPSA